MYNVQMNFWDGAFFYYVIYYVIDYLPRGSTQISRRSQATRHFSTCFASSSGSSAVGEATSTLQMYYTPDRAEKSTYPKKVFTSVFICGNLEFLA
jgi:hypothetical protein